MKIKKMGVYLGTVSLITLLILGCGSSQSNNDDNATIDIETNNAHFMGSAIDFVLEGLAHGILSEGGGEILGELLSLVGWGDSSNTTDEKALKNINKNLEQISKEINVIDSELKQVFTLIEIETDTILMNEAWPKGAKTNIDASDDDLNSSRYCQDNNVSRHLCKVGEANQKDINTTVDGIINESKRDIRRAVVAIEDSFKGSGAEADGSDQLLNLYVNKSLLKMTYYDDDNLFNAYKGLEALTSKLLHLQARGVNQIIEAYNVLEGKQKAHSYLFGTYMPKIKGEIYNLNNNYSFINNTLRLVLKNAPLYDNFLPASAEAILKRAVFYRSLVTRADNVTPSKNAFGVRIFHISTADMPKSPEELYIAKDHTSSYPCQPSRHSVNGRAYDFWDDEKGTVKSHTDYNVVEYICEGDIPNGTYQIYDSVNLDSKSMGNAVVSQYDTNYEKNTSGSISYGFALLTNNKDDHFPLSSKKWKTQKPQNDNIFSYTEVHLPDSWSIVTKADHSNSDSVDAVSKARIELDGYFKYVGEQDPDNPTTMYVDFHAGFYAYANAPGVNDSGRAWSNIYIGIYDIRGNNVTAEYTPPLTLQAKYDNSPQVITRDVTGTMHFKPEPGKEYYIYFNMTSSECCDDRFYAETNLNTIHNIHIRFTPEKPKP